MHKYIVIAVVFALIIFSPAWLEAQCSMCRLIAENSYQSGSEIGRGLNSGIMYIMGIPYLLLLVGGIILFRKNFSK